MRSSNKKNRPYLDAYSPNVSDGYTENIFGNYENVDYTTNSDEFFMQWIFPEQLHRIAMRTAVGYRITHGEAKDIWGNKLGIKLPKQRKKSEQLNEELIPYLQSRVWYQEGEKFTGMAYELGEALWLLYFNDEGTVQKYKEPIEKFAEILKVEAISKLDYYIPEFDAHGEPVFARIKVKSNSRGLTYEYVDVDPSRFIRKIKNNVEYSRRYESFSRLAPVYDAIVILSTILKACGEAAFRWGTGHPVIYTKDLINEAEFAKLKDKLENFTRRSWHMIPYEYVEKIDMLGQAGSMLNLKALADICLDQIVIGTGYPKSMLLGDATGQIQGSEVPQNVLFSLHDADRTDLEPQIMEYFKRDINVQKLFKKYGVTYYELDWGIREVHTRTQAVELHQKEISNAIAMTQIATFNECREEIGLEPLAGDNAEMGEIVLGLEPFYMAAMQQEMMEEQTAIEPQITTNYNQAARTTEKKASSTKDLEKNKKISPKREIDSVISQKYKMYYLIDSIIHAESINQFCDELKINPKTLNKIHKNLKDEIVKWKKEKQILVKED